MSEWPIVRLGDYCQKIGSGATPRGGSKVYLDSGKTYLIRSQNVYNDGFKAGGLVCIDEDAAQKLKNVIVKQDDVLLNITGDSVARACLVDPSFMPARVNQHVAIIRPDREEFDARFIRYFLVRPDTQNMLLAMAGVGGTRNALTKGMIEGLEIPKPKIEEQQSIADALSCLDAKIDLNRQTNQTLEQIAQAIFKSWFVDFEPVKAKQHIRSIKGNDEQTERAAQAVIAGAVNLDVITTATDLSALDRRLIQVLGEKLAHQTDAQREQLVNTAQQFPDRLVEAELGLIPEGWVSTTLSKMIRLIGGGTPKKSESRYWNGAIPWFSVKDAPDDGQVFVLDTDLKITDAGLSESSTRLLDEGTTIISARGTVGRLALVGVPMAMNQSCYGVTGADGIPPIFNYFNLRRAVDVLKQNTHGAVFDTITRETFETVDQIMPQKKVIRCFEVSVESLIFQVKSNGQLSRSLAQLRGVLLPKLLSGELTPNQSVQPMRVTDG